MTMPSLKILCAALLTIPLVACGTTGATGGLAQRTQESIPPAPVADGPADDGPLAMQAQQATLEEALDNETRGWRNPHTGSLGTVTPLRTTHGGGCREYRETVVHDGREASRTETACKNTTGLWVVSRD